MRRRLIVLGSIAALAACSSQPNKAPEIAAVVAYLGNSDGTWRVYGIDPQDRRSGQLASTDLDEDLTNIDRGAIAWNSDGTKVAVANLSWVKVIDVRAKTTHVVARRADDLVEDPAWSPDGERLAYVDDGLVVVNPDGSHKRTYHDTRGVFAADPVWSPDGKRIAFSVQYGIRVVDVKTGGLWAPVQETDPGATEQPRWSADGRRISYVSSRPRHGYSIFTVSTVDGTRRPVGRTTDVYGVRIHAWAPEGNRLAFACGEDLCVTDVELGTEQRVARSHAGEQLHDPVWSPDGTRLVYLRDRGGAEGADLWVVGADGTNGRALTRAFPTGGTTTAPTWSSVPLRSPPPPERLTVARLAQEQVARSPNIIVDLNAHARIAATVEGERRCRVSLFAPRFGNTTRVAWPALCGSNGGESWHTGNTARTVEGTWWTAVATNHHDDEFWSLMHVASGRLAPRSVPLPYGHELYFTIGQLISDGDDVFVDIPGRCVNYDYRCPAHIGFELWRRHNGRWHRVVNGKQVYSEISIADNAMLVRGPTTVTAYELDGRVRGRLSFPRGSILDAFVRARDIVMLLRNGKLEVRKLADGTTLRSFDVDVTSNVDARIEDAERDLVAIAAGAALHVVRLGDGHKIRIGARNAAPPVHAQLEPEGLFYSYTVVRSRQPGRLAFVPARFVDRALNTER